MGSGNHQSTYIAMVAAPFIVITAIIVITMFVRLPTLVYMAVPIVLLAHTAVIFRMVDRWSAEAQQSAQASRTGSTGSLGPACGQGFQLDSASHGREVRSRFTTIRTSLPLVIFGIVSVLIWFIPAMLLLLFVMLGIVIGYVVSTEVRSEKAIQQRVASGGYTEPWWSTSHTPMRLLRNVLFLFLGILLIVLFLFLPILGIVLAAGIFIGLFVAP